MVDGRTPEQGYTISSPCEQESSCELIIGGKDPPKLIEGTLGRNDQERSRPKRPVHICTTIVPIVSQSESENKLKTREINYNFMAKNNDKFSFSIFVRLIH